MLRRVFTSQCELRTLHTHIKILSAIDSKYRSMKVRIHYWSRSSCNTQRSTAIADNMIYANVLLLQQIAAVLNIYIKKERPAARCLSRRQGISEMNNARDWDS